MGVAVYEIAGWVRKRGDLFPDVMFRAAKIQIFSVWSCGVTTCGKSNGI